MSPPWMLSRAVQVQSQRLLRHRCRYFCSSLSSSSSSSSGKVKRIERFDEFEEMVQREIVEDVEKVERTKTEDRDSINRMLTSCGMPKGEFRDKLMWGCNVAAIFVVSGAVGSLIAKIDGIV